MLDADEEEELEEVEAVVEAEEELEVVEAELVLIRSQQDYVEKELPGLTVVMAVEVVDQVEVVVVVVVDEAVSFKVNTFKELTSQYASAKSPGLEATYLAQVSNPVFAAHFVAQVASPKSPQKVVSKMICISLKLLSMLQGVLKTA